VHIFTHQGMEAVRVDRLECTVYGAGFTAMDCPGLLEDFSARSNTRYTVGVLHGDPTQVTSAYCPITTEQVKRSALDYLALGHIHKGSSFRAGKTLCAWPGCPMGRGYDETGEKGVLVVTLDETAEAEFIPLATPRFHDLEIPATTALEQLLPPVGNDDFYRITFTGPSEPLNLEKMYQEYARFPHLVLRDRTTPPVDLWGAAGDDTLEGMYFGLLRDAMEQGDENVQHQVRLAAQISRQILDGQEVVLP
jgi:DNA repair exonuclease SbcCD nuclease subunit